MAMVEIGKNGVFEKKDCKQSKYFIEVSCMVFT